MTRQQSLGQLHSDLGEVRGRLDVLVEMMTREHAEARENRRLVFDRLNAVEARAAAVEHKVSPLPEAVRKHGEDIDDLQTFRTHVGAVVVIAGTVWGLLLTGVGWLITQFWDQLAAFARRFIG